MFLASLILVCIYSMLEFTPVAKEKILCAILRVPDSEREEKIRELFRGLWWTDEMIDMV